MKNLFSIAILTLFLSLNFLISSAQERTIKIEPKVNSNRSVDFEFQKTDPGSYTVVMNFNSLTNTSVQGTSFTASDYSGRLLTLTPTNKDQGIGYRYTVSYIRGKLKPKYNANFIYLLPYKNEKIQVAESGFLGAMYFGDTAPDDWKSYRFYAVEQDTVRAIRKGIVVDIKDVYGAIKDNGVAYTNQTNSLIIEHQDGTLATYRGFEKGSFAVKLGQVVFPTTALGLNSKYDANGKYNVSIMITYLKSADLENRSTTLSKSKSFYGFVTPHFLTADSEDEILISQKTYKSGSKPEVVEKEMTKRELKLLGYTKK